MYISVIIPALNEEENIATLVTFIKEHSHNKIKEIIVADGGSTDNTCKAAATAGATVLNSTVKSRAAQMNMGAQHSSGEILYFIHADVKIIPSFVSDIFEALAEGYTAGCYRYLFNSTKKLLKFNAYCIRFNGIMCRGGDQTLFITKNKFEQLNGYNEHFTIMEDYDFIIRLRKKNKFKIIPKNIIVSARKYETNSWLRVQVANLTIFMLFFMKTSPAKLKSIYKKMLHYR